MSDPLVEDLRRHLVDDVLAWWSAHGPDPAHGGVLTCWDNAGSRLVSTDKYTWSQGRWTWLTARLGEIDPHRPVHVVCASGNRSSAMADVLTANGFDAMDVAGGTRAWIRSGRPIEK